MNDEQKFETIKGVIGGLIILTLFFWLLLFSGCKVSKNQKINTKDSTSVTTSKEGSVRVDSSGSKSDKTYTNETFFFPGRDTTINNYIFQPANIPAPTVYIRETGTEKTEQAQIITDTSWREAFNSLAVLIASKETQTKKKVGPSFIEWILIAGLGLLLIKNFLPFTIIKK
jgi:hypothetical protein